MIVNHNGAVVQLYSNLGSVPTNSHKIPNDYSLGFMTSKHKSNTTAIVSVYLPCCQNFVG